MSEKRKSRFANAETIEIQNGEDLLDAGKDVGKNKASKPFINLSSLNTESSKNVTSSYSSTEKHEDMLKEMIEESGKYKSEFMRYMIETFHDMTRGQ